MALAIRLQQENGERVSIDDLRRTAVEAGIDPIYLETALNRIHTQAPAKAERLVPQRHVVAIVVVAVFIMFSMVILNWAHDHGEWGEAAWMMLLAAVIGARILLPRRRNAPISRLSQRQD